MDSDEEPLSNLAAFKRRQESELEIIPVFPNTTKTPKPNKSTKKPCSVTIEVARADSPLPMQRPTDVWMYIKDLNPNGPYSCLLCSEWFINKTKLVIHYIVDHQKNYCGICRYFVADDEAWLTHQNFHKPWPCSQCQETYQEVSELQKHFSEVHKLIHCKLCHTRVSKNEYNNHLFKKHNMADITCQTYDIYWLFENDNYEKFKCFLCTKSNNSVKQFVNHYISFHHITLKCLAPLLCGKKQNFCITGAELTPSFIETELKGFTKFGYVDLKPTDTIVNESNVTYNNIQIDIKEEVLSDSENNRDETKQDDNKDETKPEEEVPTNTDPDRVDIPQGYSGEVNFDVTLMELIIIHECYYEYLKDTFKSIDTNLIPNLNINYETAIVNKLIDVECSLCTNKYTTLNSFMSHMTKMHCVKTLPTFSCRICATPFDSLNELSQHLLQELGDFDDLWICQFCDKEFDNREATRQHLTNHWDVIEEDNCFSPHLGFKCKYCPILFWNEPEREVHHVKEHFEQYKEDFYSCARCDKLFSDKIWFIHHFIHRHQSNHSAVPLYLVKCCICCLSLPSVEDMKIHFDMNHPEATKVFCSLGTCKHKPFSHKKSFQLHLKMFHERPRRRGEGRTSCTVCGLQFATRRSCAAHAAQAHRLSCAICPTKLSTLDERKIHYLIQHPGRHPYQCDVCEKSFQYKSSLYLHKHDHSPNKHDYACTYCGKVFKKRESFREHMAIHVGVRHACSYCPAVFVQRSNMLRHERRHTGERPYACSECPRTFSDKGACTSHARTHQKEPSFACMYCGQTFVQKSKLNYHIRKHTGENLETCTICSKMFTSGCSLREHLKIHDKKDPEGSVKCPICAREYQHERSMVKHMRSSHTGARHVCPICRKEVNSAASLREHVLTHSDLKTFKCKVCPKSYNVKRTMMHHLRRRHGLNVADATVKEFYTKLDPRDCNLQLDNETIDSIFGRRRNKANDILIGNFVTINQQLKATQPQPKETDDQSSEESEKDSDKDMSVTIKQEPASEEPEQVLEPTDFVSVKIEPMDYTENS